MGPVVISLVGTVKAKVIKKEAKASFAYAITVAEPIIKI